MNFSLGETARKIWRGSGAKNLYLTIGYLSLYREWCVLRERPTPLPSRGTGNFQTVVVLPPDPELLRASKGDDAMLTVLIDRIRSWSPDARILVATGTKIASGHVRAMRAEPLDALDNVPLSTALRKILAVGPSHLFLVGADVLDGSYDPRFSLRLLGLADLAARHGVSTTVTGFSVSARPFPRLGRVYSEVHPSVRLCLRDPVSQRRFDRLGTARSVGVADIAFLLEPDCTSTRSMDTREWINRRKGSGRVVIGLNIHPLLLSDTPRVPKSRLLTHVAEAVAHCARSHSLSVVLLAHDFRDGAADRHCLDPLETLLDPVMGDELYHVRDEYSAAEIKGIVGRLDGVVSGRMHLAIAALGTATPVLGLEYKDKMAGLFQHFGLNSKYSLPASQTVLRGDLSAALDAFIAELPQLQAAVAAALPHVKDRAANNFAMLID